LELIRLLGNHGRWAERLAEAGYVMEPLPFPGAVWMIGTGENVSGNLLSGRDRSPITPAITSEFCLPKPSAGTAFLANLRLKRSQLLAKLTR
ncbi:hypothetical protein OAX95_01285, partial [bacterium]|nr:hypothetical protein [bacterium]